MEFQNMQHVHLPENALQGDGLNLMLELQKVANKQIYPIVLKNLGIISDGTLENLTTESKEELTKEYCIAVIRECAEILDMINSKTWKDKKFEIDEREIKFELIDVQKFLNTLYLIWGMDRDSIIQYYEAKHNEVLRRYKDGY